MKRVSPKSIKYIVGLVGALVFLAFTMTSTRTRPARTRTTKQAAETASAATPETAKGPLAQAAPSDADFGRYQLIVARDIFSPPPPATPPKPPISLPPPFVMTPEEGRPKPPPPPVAPSLSSWSYVGYVTVDGGTVGILQNDETKSMKELKRGDLFEGYRVEEISRKEMGLSFGATKVSLKPEPDYSLVPLQAATGGQQPGGPQPGRPGGPRPRGGGPPEHP